MRRHPDIAVSGRARAGEPALQRAAKQVGTQPRRPGAAPHEILSRREHGIIQHHAVPASALALQREVWTTLEARPAEEGVGTLARDAPADRQAVGVEHAHAELAPVHGEGDVEQSAQDPGAEILVVRLDQPVGGGELERGVGSADLPAGRIEYDRLPIGAERKLDGAVGEDGRAELREFGQLQHRKQCVTARAVGGDRARAVAPHGQLDQDRLEPGGVDRGLGVRRRRRQERRKQERGHGPARNHGRCSSSESRTGRAASRVSGARSSRSVVTSTRRRYGPGGSLPSGSAAVKRGSTS